MLSLCARGLTACPAERLNLTCVGTAFLFVGCTVRTHGYTASWTLTRMALRRRAGSRTAICSHQWAIGQPRTARHLKWCDARVCLASRTFAVLSFSFCDGGLPVHSNLALHEILHFTHYSRCHSSCTPCLTVCLALFDLPRRHDWFARPRTAGCMDATQCKMVA